MSETAAGARVSDASSFGRSNHTCKFALSYGGHLRSAECLESHLFRPFSSGESGARTDVKQTLTLVETSTPDAEADTPRLTATAFARRATMLFEHEEPVTEACAGTMDAVKASLASLAQRTKDSVDKESAAMFSRLVADLRSLQLKELSLLFDETEDL